MKENQKDQTTPGSQNGNRSEENNNNKKEAPPLENNTREDEESDISVPADDTKEQEPRKHPHEISVPVAKKEDRSSL